MGVIDAEHNRAKCVCDMTSRYKVWSVASAVNTYDCKMSWQLDRDGASEAKQMIARSTSAVLWPDLSGRHRLQTGHSDISCELSQHYSKGA